MDMVQKPDFKKYQYINLETYRKTGEGVRTPVWFAYETNSQGSPILYVWTMGTSGKAKRVRRNPRVKIVPSDGRGNPLGSWIEGEARIADPQLYEHGHGLINRKYGVMKWLISLFNRQAKNDRVIIAIQLKN